MLACYDVAASYAARAEENANDDGDDPLGLPIISLLPSARNISYLNETSTPRTPLIPFPLGEYLPISLWRGIAFFFGREATTGTFNQVEAYDPATDSWSTYAPMPTARHGLGAIAVDGRIYVIAGGPTPGGSTSSSALLANEIFIP
jgi:hypothetical protein